MNPYIALSLTLIVVFGFVVTIAVVIIAIGFFRLSKSVNQLCIRIELQGEKHESLITLWAERFETLMNHLKTNSLDIENILEEIKRVWEKINALKTLLLVSESEIQTKEMYEARIRALSKLK